MKPMINKANINNDVTCGNEIARLVVVDIISINNTGPTVTK